MGTVLVTLPRMILAYAVAKGADADALERAAGLHPLPPGNDARVPRERIDALFDLAAAALDDPALGVHLALALPQGNTGVLEIVTQSAPDLRTGLAHLARYWHLINDGVDVHVEERDAAVVLSIRTRAPKPLARGWTDLTVIALGVFGLRAITASAPLSFVDLPYPEDEVGRRVGEMLGAAARFDAPHIALGLRRELLDAPLLNRNAAIHDLATRHADALLLAHHSGDGDWLARVRAAIDARLATGDASVERVAKSLGTSERSLQRQLRLHGTSLRALVDDARRRVAERELATRDTSITDLAFLLGFSEASAFDRAFRRWTGTSPLAYRAASAKPGGRPRA